jgi:hypothetical protein
MSGFPTLSVRCEKIFKELKRIFMKENQNKIIKGYFIAICGFICIIAAAINYIFHWKMGIPPAAIGIVFLAVGMMWVRKGKDAKNKLQNPNDK